MYQVYIRMTMSVVVENTFEKIIFLKGRARSVSCPVTSDSTHHKTHIIFGKYFQTLSFGQNVPQQHMYHLKD